MPTLFFARSLYVVNTVTQASSPAQGTPELELELIQTQMAQKPMLRAEVYAHAMRASQNRKKEVRREKGTL